MLSNSNSNWKQNLARNKSEAKTEKVNPNESCPNETKDAAQTQVEVATKEAEANFCTSEPKTADVTVDNW